MKSLHKFHFEARVNDPDKPLYPVASEVVPAKTILVHQDPLATVDVCGIPSSTCRDHARDQLYKTWSLLLRSKIKSHAQWCIWLKRFPVSYTLGMTASLQHQHQPHLSWSWTDQQDQWVRTWIDRYMSPSTCMLTDVVQRWSLWLVVGWFPRSKSPNCVCLVHPQTGQCDIITVRAIASNEPLTLPGSTDWIALLHMSTVRPPPLVPPFTLTNALLTGTWDEVKLAQGYVLRRIEPLREWARRWYGDPATESSIWIRLIKPSTLYTELRICTILVDCCIQAGQLAKRYDHVWIWQHLQMYLKCLKLAFVYRSDDKRHALGRQIDQRVRTVRPSEEQLLSIWARINDTAPKWLPHKLTPSVTHTDPNLIGYQRIWNDPVHGLVSLRQRLLNQAVAASDRVRSKKKWYTTFSFRKDNTRASSGNAE